MCYFCAVKPGRFRCHQCGSGQVLCTVCDAHIHQQKPLHDRQVWLDGFWLPIAPTTTFIETEASMSSQGTYTSHVTVDTHIVITICPTVCCIPFSMPSHCPLCGGHGQTELVPTASMRTVVTLQGMYFLV